MFLLASLIRKYGVHNLIQLYDALGWELAIILAFPLVWYVLQTAAWHLTLEEMGAHISFGELLSIKLGGEAVNTLTPVSWLGGDPVRIYMLQKKMPATLSTAATVLDRTTYTVSIVLLLLLGFGVAWVHLPMPGSWRLMFPVLIVLIVLALWFFMHHQTVGMFDFFSRCLSRLGFKKHEGVHIQEKITELDALIARFYQNHPKRFALVILLQFLGRLAGVVENYMIARFMHLNLSWEGALFLASLTILVNLVFVFIPGSLGVMEGAYGGLVSLLGLPPVAGVGIQLVRRLRTLFWVFVGIITMLRFKGLIGKSLGKGVAHESK